MSTLSERILGAAAGEYVDRKVDRAYAHNGTGVLALEAWKKMSSDRLGKETEYYLQFDHITPANNSTTATLQHRTQGICTQDLHALLGYRLRHLPPADERRYCPAR